MQTEFFWLNSVWLKSSNIDIKTAGSASLIRKYAVLRMFALCVLGFVLLSGCGQGLPNNPYANSDTSSDALIQSDVQSVSKSIHYTAFSARPKHLDPALSYTSDEATFTYSVYEPLFQYHYLKRPYSLEPLTAQTMPEVVWLNQKGEVLPKDTPPEQVAYSRYVLRIKPGIRYQPHPAFARGPDGVFLYHELGDSGANYFSPQQFEVQATRELLAEDYVYQIKRLASSRLVSPVLGHMGDYILGLDDLSKLLKTHDEALKAKTPHNTQPLPWLDLRKYPLPGARALGPHELQITLKGVYPQFMYWLAMPFFAPMPWEADAFYSQSSLKANNLTLDWWPVGTGPFMLTENDPNRRMVLSRNPNFRGEAYPSVGEATDALQGYLRDAGKTMPFVDEVVFTREKETIPYWNKFLQGYYDTSGIGSDSFDQAIRLDNTGDASLAPELQEKGMRLEMSLATSIFYLAFNGLDPVVGNGKTPEATASARYLRQAIAIALDWEEFSNIFTNGRAMPAHGPIPPGLFGHIEGQAGFNRTVYDVLQIQDVAGGVPKVKPQRKSITHAQALLAKAGFPKGINPATGKPLTLALDTTAGGPGDKARFDWYRKQFRKLNIDLEIRATDWNRFQEKIRKGNTQMFFLGWNADYPDPENFLFLLYGPNSRAKTGGENAANYQNAQYDALFERMKHMPNGPERAEIIARMVKLVQEDTPWAFAFVPRQYGLVHGWMHNVKPNDLARNDLKYIRIDDRARAELQNQWNQPLHWPLWILALFVSILLWPAWRMVQQRKHSKGLRPDIAQQLLVEKKLHRHIEMNKGPA